MRRPRLLDLFCGAGGGAVGYHRAGFDVTGVDNRPQPRYPFEFHQADAMTWPLDGYDAIHASPPCQLYSRASGGRHDSHVDLIAPIRERLQASGVPWVMENVPYAPLRPDLKLCGCMFPALLELERERWFETSWQAFDLRPSCSHQAPIIVVTGHGRCRGMRGTGLAADWRRAMGIDWMTRDELSQAIPPAYTEHIGTKLLEYSAITLC